MSTRTNIVIKDKFMGHTFYIYRHHDGYPAYPGEHVLEIAKMNNATNAIKYLLTREDANYEMTTNIHGDIEHLYVVELPTGKIEYGTGGYGQEIVAEKKTRQEFADLVNKDRKHINDYIRSQGKEKEWGLFEMVEA